MSVLLPTDEVALYPAEGDDEHGWSTPGSEPSWTGSAAVQLGPGITRVRAADEGGHGPFGPASIGIGNVYLPPDAPASDGMVLTVRGDAYALSETRLVVDPTGGDLTCKAAVLSEVSQWPG